MFQLRLTRRPSGYDRYNLPCYTVNQQKGLNENQIHVRDKNIHTFIRKAIVDGYGAYAASASRSMICSQVKKLADNDKLDILEIGGGSGALFDWLIESANSYINIEPGDLQLNDKDLNRLKNPNYMCIKCSAEDIPLSDNSVDVIISFSSLDHVPDYRKALAEIQRLLRHNGQFILSINNSRSWWKLLLSKTRYLKRREDAIAKSHYIQWSAAECKFRVARYLEPHKLCTTTFFPFVPKIWRICLPICNIIGKFILRRFGANTFAVFEK
jgi:SAM-dependent methyltransferase